MDIIDLDARRRAAEEDQPSYVTCACGEAWFELRGNHPQMPERGAVTIRPDGGISGYAGTPHCVSCGKVITLSPAAK